MSNNGKPRIPRPVIDGGIVVLLIISIFAGYYMIDQALKIAYDTKKQQEITDKKIDDFVDTWKKRIAISNNINNLTQEKLNQTLIELKNATAEREIQSDETEHSILSNLTGHRAITNATNQKVLELHNDTNKLLQQFNATNEEERGKAVSKLSHQHEIIIEALNQLGANVTLPENKTQPDVQELLKQLLNDTS